MKNVIPALLTIICGLLALIAYQLHDMRPVRKADIAQDGVIKHDYIDKLPLVYFMGAPEFPRSMDVTVTNAVALANGQVIDGEWHRSEPIRVTFD